MTSTNKTIRGIIHTIHRSSLFVLMMGLFLGSCEEFVDIAPPTNELTGSVVFEEAATVDAAFAHIHSQLREDVFTTGTVSGLSYLMGHYTDELTLYSNVLPEVQEFANGRLTSSNGSVERLWDGAYELIYATNSILEGVQNSTELGQEDVHRFLGEAYFLRALLHFHLMELFGPVPFIDSTNFDINSKVGRMDLEPLSILILEDLRLAKEFLAQIEAADNYRPNYWTATAFLARFYLYREEWSNALTEVLEVEKDGPFGLEEDLLLVFKKDSPETLWQLDSGIPGNNTKEGSTFVFSEGPPPNSALNNDFINRFEAGDGRLQAWVGQVVGDSETWYYANKYKLNAPSPSTEECSILFRLSELYLIGAEAYARLGQDAEALAYLNRVRQRALLDPISGLSGTALLDAIYKERAVELFSEQGHRFFDLKRTARADAILGVIKPEWEPFAINLPIPQSDLLLNPNLAPQNEGY